MTSSLVGSEMCIRDRCLFSQVSPWGACPDTIGPSPCCNECGDKLHPVSYTHLTLPTICSV
eukprot:5631775-Prorocentrum_lima.AAC.1